MKNKPRHEVKEDIGNRPKSTFFYDSNAGCVNTLLGSFFLLVLDIYLFVCLRRKLERLEKT